VQAGSYLEPSVEMCSGDAAQALSVADHMIEGEIYIGGQEHFYMETHACLVVPKSTDSQLEIFCSAQGTSFIQVHLHSLAFWQGKQAEGGGNCLP